MKYIPTNSTDKEALLSGAVESAQKAVDQAIKLLVDERWAGPYPWLVPIAGPVTARTLSSAIIARNCWQRDENIKNMTHAAAHGSRDSNFYVESFRQQTIAAAAEIVTLEVMQKRVTEARTLLQNEIETARDPKKRNDREYTQLELVNISAAIELLRAVRRVELAINDVVERLPELIKDRSTVMSVLEQHAHRELDTAFKDGKFVLAEPEAPKS